MAEGRKQLGLIGRPLSHSFSKSFFTDKFRSLGLTNYHYELYELETIEEFLPLVKHTPDLIGINVTIPYKKEVMGFLDEISAEAKAIGAVNVIKIDGNKLYGFNTDYYGFKTSLLNWLPNNWHGKALILGTGGASLAVIAALTKSEIPYHVVSRNSGTDLLTYDQVKALDLLATHRLVLNTTPLGMQPQVNTAPDLDYHKIGSKHYLFDLVYNPASTTFMRNGAAMGAKVKNGLEMLELQAEKAWDIWTSNQ
jgi:shikimate dehydrogenase